MDLEPTPDSGSIWELRPEPHPAHSPLMFCKEAPEALSNGHRAELSQCTSQQPISSRPVVRPPPAGGSQIYRQMVLLLVTCLATFLPKLIALCELSKLETPVSSKGEESGDRPRGLSIRNRAGLGTKPANQ